MANGNSGGAAGPNGVTAEFNYLAGRSEKPVTGIDPESGRLAQLAGRLTGFSMTVRDARSAEAVFGLDGAGFLLADHRSAVRDFTDGEERKAVYDAEMAELIAGLTGAREVQVFDHTLRTGDEDARLKAGIREPVKWVHNDYTNWSGPERIGRLFDDGAARRRVLDGDFAIIQVWRAIRNPVSADPLAMLDARSLAPGDLIVCERRDPSRIGEIFQLAHNPKHRWYYYPEMHRDEALVFKTYDSRTDGRTRFTPHSSFTDPAQPENAAPRESIEIRALAVF